MAKRKTLFKTIFSILAFSFVVQTACSPASAEKKNGKKKLPDNEEVLNIKDYPEEVMKEGYTHPYRWNRLEGEKVGFDEIWGYVLANRLGDWNKDAPITDIGLFACEVDCYGNLSDVPSRNLVEGFDGRVHLVAVCQSSSLTHFCLDPQINIRDNLVRSLIEASKDFDGLQIDYELVPAKDGKQFIQFLKHLKKGLGKKELTVCLPARVNTRKDDVYDYAKIAEVCDRIMIMAYDEHWATSAPGSVASFEWCKRIADYALSVVPAEKIIMGMPFYGRSWIDKSVQQAWYFNGSSRMIKENDVKEIHRVDGIPTYEAEVTVKVTGWYDDATSILKRCRNYKEMGFNSIAFWRMGQEDAAIWEWIYGGEKSPLILKSVSQE